MESYQDVKREGTTTLIMRLASESNVHNRKHASHVLQVARCRSESEKQAGDFAGDRERDVEDSTGGRVGQMAG